MALLAKQNLIFILQHFLSLFHLVSITGEANLGLQRFCQLFLLETQTIINYYPKLLHGFGGAELGNGLKTVKMLNHSTVQKVFIRGGFLNWVIIRSVT